VGVCVSVYVSVLVCECRGVRGRLCVCMHGTVAVRWGCGSKKLGVSVCLCVCV